MGNGEQGRLLIYTHVTGWPSAPLPPADLIELSASLQRRFPGQLVESADLEWLRQAVGKSLPLPLTASEEAELMRRLQERPPERPRLAHYLAFRAFLESHEYIYLVLAWLGGTVSKQVAEQAIKAAADLIREWMRSRRSKTGDITQVAYILGPDGEVLKKVEVRPAAPTRRRTTRRRR